MSEMNSEMEEINISLGQYISQIRRAFDARFRTKNDVVDMEDEYGYLWTKEIYLDHPVLGSVLVVDNKGECFAVEYTETAEGGFEFADETAWRKVIPTYVYARETTSESEETETEETAVEELAESESGSVVELIEDGKGDEPLILNVAVIQPGWGNRAHNHYYAKDMLKRDAGIFEGVKMYTTDHRSDEKSVRTEVSQVLKCPVGFTEAGAPIARIGVFDETFAKSIRNRHKLGVLNSLHCSILASGKVRPGDFELNGRKGRYVEAITSAQSVDWVTQAGAGGHALSLAESEVEIVKGKNGKGKEKVEELEEVELREGDTPVTETEQPTLLSEAEIDGILNETNLPDASKGRMREQQWQSEYDLKSAVVSEIQYIKQITNGGRPVQVGSGSAGQAVGLDEVNKRRDRVNAKFLGTKIREVA